MASTGRGWDPSPYRGAAHLYAIGRMPYPPALVTALAAELRWDGRGRLLDVGCGPGSLSLLLAPWFARVVGVDADPEMVAEAGRQAAAAEVGNAEWIHRRAEALDTDLGDFRAVTLAQSFHWMDRAEVARRLHGLLTADGALVHVHATTHRGVDGDAPSSHPRVPHAAIDALLDEFLGSRTRAGRGQRPSPAPEGVVGEVEAEIYRAAGFEHQRRLTIPGPVLTRSTDQVLASVHSLSSAAPHLFGHRLAEFDRALRALLAAAGPDGHFDEQLREFTMDVWRPGLSAS